MAIDYDKYLDKTYGPEEDRLFYCSDMWCDGHALPSQTCLSRDEEQ